MVFATKLRPHLLSLSMANDYVLVTGANGFIGRALVGHLVQKGFRVRAAVRNTETIRNPGFPGVDTIAVGNVGDATDWSAALRSIDVVIHLAGRAHVVAETAPDPLAAFRRINTDGSVSLARQAANARRFIFVSSIGVNGNFTSDLPFSEASPTLPHDPYAISKFEAEQQLTSLSDDTGLELVIVRPTLVYGPHNRGNFLRLLQLVKRNWPLPFGCVQNCRSLLYVENLASALTLCVDHPSAIGETYLVSDAENISTPDLIVHLARQLGVPTKLLPVPTGVLRALGTLTGKSGEFERLLGSLRVDSSKIRRDLGWSQPYTMAEGLQKTADWFRNT